MTEEQIRADEREKCAKACEEWIDITSHIKPAFWDLKYKWVLHGHRVAYKFCADAIRNIGNDK